MGWSSMGAGSEWTSPSQSGPIHPLLESTWDGPHMVVVAVAEEVEAVEAAAVAVAPVVVRRDVLQGTMTGATTEVMTEVMIVTTIAMTTESTDHTDADLHLRTTAEATAHDPGLGPTRHVTTDQLKKKETVQCYCSHGFFSLLFMFLYVFAFVFKSCI